MVPALGVNIRAKGASIGAADTTTESAAISILTWATEDLAKLRKVVAFAP